MEGKEGIALILTIIFMVAISILLVTVLLLANQEIYATQIQLDGHKALYYAEAGVEYGVAQLINGVSSEELNADSVGQFLKQTFGVDDLKLNVSKTTIDNKSAYSVTCEVRHNRFIRKITKIIQLYVGIWGNAMASNGNINLSANPGQGGEIIINGDIYSNGSINFDKNDDPRSLPGVYIPSQYNWSSGQNLPFPSINFDYYKAIAVKVYNSVDEFVNDASRPTSGIVYINGDLHIVKIKGLSITGLTIVVNGDIHINNQQEMTIDGGSNMAMFIAKNMKFNNDGIFNFTNCIIYAAENIDFKNMKKNVTIENGAIYAQNGYIDLNNIKDTFKVTRGTWKYTDIGHFFDIFDIYKLVSWTDYGV